MISEIYLRDTTKMENEGASTVCPLDPSSLLFLSGDGFEPAGVFFPHAAFYFPPKDKKEAYDFMDKVGIRFSFLNHTSYFFVIFVCFNARLSTNITVCAMRGNAWVSKGTHSRLISLEWRGR